MRYGSIYLVVSDFEKSLKFYETLFDMKVSARNGDRFAIFENQGLNLCLLNSQFDSMHKDEIIRKGEYNKVYDDMETQ